MDGAKSKYADRYQCFVVDPNNFKYDNTDIKKDHLNFGYIIKATEKANGKQPERTVAIHQLDENNPNENTDISKIFLRELELYVSVKPYIGIPSFYGYYFAPEKSIVTEYLKKGSLARFYAKLNENNEHQKNLWDDTFKAKLVFGIACTMMHLHTFKAIHRRLNPDVICFDKDYNPKVTEFAFSKIQIDDTKVSDPRLKQNSFYVSPEIVEGKEYSTKSDVYSFGVLLLSIVQGNENFKVDESTRSLIYPSEPKLVSSIIKNSINPNPSKRPTFSQIVKAIKDCQHLFPETDENQYRNFVQIYFQAVSIAPQDQQLFSNKPKSKNTNKRPNKTKFYSSAYPKSNKNGSETKSSSQAIFATSSYPKSSKNGNEKKNTDKKLFQKSSKSTVKNPADESQQASQKSTKEKSKLNLSKSGTKSNRKHDASEDNDSEEEKPELPKHSSPRIKSDSKSHKSSSGDEIDIEDDDHHSDEEEKPELPKHSSPRIKSDSKSHKSSSGDEIDIEDDDDHHSDEVKSHSDEEEGRKQKKKHSQSSSEYEIDIKASSSDDNDEDSDKPEIVEIENHEEDKKEDFYSHDTDIIPIVSDDDNNNEEEDELVSFANTKLNDILAKAEDGDAYAMVQAGRAYERGELDAKIDQKEAFEWYKKAAEKGHVIGLYNYATCLKTGFGTEIDMDLAYDTMKEAAKTEKNNPVAMNTYGRWLLEQDRKKNQKEALKYFERSMREGNIDATLNAAKIYASTGQTEKAKRAFLNAGELGILSAYNDYAFLCLEDPSTIAEGILILKQNAARNSPESNYNLGRIELEGRYNCDVNPSSAFNYFKKAAHLNQPEGCFFYAKLLASGEGDWEKNTKRAAFYYKKAISLGNTMAMINYAIMLQKDNVEGVQQNLEKAASLLKQAADKGNKFAMKKYAKCLSEGKGVEKDEDLAQEYIERAES